MIIKMNCCYYFICLVTFALFICIPGKTITNKRLHKRYKFNKFNKDSSKSIFLNRWAVIVHGDENMANQVARENGFANKGKVFGNVYEFVHAGIPKRRKRASFVKSIHLRSDTRVVFAEQQEAKKRVKRSISFNDKEWKRQWYLHRDDFGFSNQHMNVIPVWKKGYTGKGVVVSVLDDGLEYTHPEIAPNYDPKASYDFNNNDTNPLPRYNWRDDNRHGTRCAGEIAAAGNNSYCVVGVAYGASIGGIRMLDGEITDLVESQSLSFARDYIDIYSSSWGPEDSGEIVDGPGPFTKIALEEGAKFGRKGKGNIVVWASGNGGDKDNCNCDGYTNSIYTISVGAATSIGFRPWYLETCASTLVSAYSTGSTEFEKSIISSDLRSGCTEDHTGTSAAQPLVSGFIALALEANPKLTWRDVQHLLVLSSSLKLLDGKDFKYNAAGLQYSHHFGYGIVDGEKLITLAERWATVPEQHKCINRKEIQGYPTNRFNKTHPLELKIKASGCHGTLNFIRYAEHVLVKTTFFHQRRGSAQILIESPKGTQSWVLRTREKDIQNGEFRGWEFLSTHFWGEDPRGEWKVIFYSEYDTGYLNDMSLIIYGTEQKPGIRESTSSNQNFPCHQECLNGCTGPTNNDCVQCKSVHFVDSNKIKHCVEECPKSMFLSNNRKLCLPCREKCISCAGNKEGECWLCEPGIALHNGECLSQCPEGWFSVSNPNGHLECHPCGEKCIKCYGKASNCTECVKGSIREGSICSAKCTGKEWLDGESCKPCHPSCKSCEGGGSQYNCTLCPKISLNDIEDRFLYQNSQCLISCPIGTFKDNTIKQHCINCPNNCLRCSNEGYKCEICNVTHYRIAGGDGKCVKECPEGYYTDVIKRICEPCDLQCSRCVPGTPSACLACMDGFYLKEHECVAATECQTRYYVNETTRKCEFCPENCSFCISASRCTVCELSYFLTTDEQCVETCPNGSYALDRQTTCAKCFPTCSECQGPASHDCIACPSNRYLLDGKCITEVPSGYYAEQIEKTKICKPCHHTCTECNGPKPSDCTTCLETLDKRKKGCLNPCVDQWLSANKCESCHPSCQSCYGPQPNQCLQCSGNFSLNKESHSCSKVCPRKYYKDKATFLCKKCHHSCASCNGPNANQCLTCPDKLQFHNKTCVLQCPTGWFKTFGQQCAKCSNKCKKCLFKYDLCTDCHEGNVSKNFKCFPDCGLNSFQVKRNRCYPCYENCNTCYGTAPNECASCSQGYSLEYNMCVKGCLPAFFNSTKEKRCVSCPENCLKCAEESNHHIKCTLCTNKTVLTPDGSCEESCPIGTYHKQLTNECDKCPGRGCATCNENTCFTCKPLYMLSNKICKSTCGKEMYPDIKLEQCKSCHKNCMGCYGATEHDCERCTQDSLTLIQKIKKISCLDECSAGFYPEKGICKDCRHTCKTCSNETECLSCFDGEYLYNNTCQAVCPIGYYKDQLTNVCGECKELVLGCLACNTTYCYDCDKGFYGKNGSCVKNCTEGFVANRTNCNPCDEIYENCERCNISTCQKCSRGFELKNLTCVPNCEMGYKLVNKTCIICKNNSCDTGSNNSMISSIEPNNTISPKTSAVITEAENSNVEFKRIDTGSELLQVAVANLSKKQNVIAPEISNSKRSKRSLEYLERSEDTERKTIIPWLLISLCFGFIAIAIVSTLYFYYRRSKKKDYLSPVRETVDTENNDTWRNVPRIHR